MLALIAGQGSLPALVHAGLDPPPLVCELDGMPSGLPDPLRFRIETLGRLLDDLAARGVTEVCFAGAIRRPDFDPAAVDEATRPLVERIADALSSGDDAALRVILAVFEERGMRVRAPQDLVPGLLPPPGVLTRRSPDARDRSDADRAAAIHAVLAPADVGQALAVAAGQALAIEALGGTDWMLGSLSGARRPGGPEGGLLFKAPKAGQDRRVDLPSIGPETIPGVTAAGLSGLVIEAGGVLVLDRDETLRRADAADLFLWVREP